MLRIVAILLICGLPHASFAQGIEPDTVKRPADSLQLRKGGKYISIESYAKRYQPRKALLYSAVIPGMGQIYNKKYWKLPIVYGGFVIITSVVVAYNNLYNQYKAELFNMIDSGSTTSTGGYTQEQLRSVVDTYRRERDFYVIIDIFWYVLQFVDAHVDAHLKEFDLNPQLKVSVAPTIQQNNMVGRASGLSITLKF